jgi:hypothetical protein
LGVEYLKSAIMAQEDILWFQITMDDIVGMEVFYSLADFICDGPNFLLIERNPFLEVIFNDLFITQVGNGRAKTL